MANLLKAADGSPVLRGSDQIYTSSFFGDGDIVKGVDKKSRTMTIIGSDETVDRDGDVISLSGWQLDNYLKNPVFLWAHDYSSVPIGAAVKLTRKRNPACLEFQIRFPEEGKFPFADLIFDLYSEKFINACSVGFIPREWEALSEEEAGEHRSPWGGHKYTKQELLELSGCPVPSNPSALQNALTAKNIGWADVKDLQTLLLTVPTGEFYSKSLLAVVKNAPLIEPKPAEYCEDLQVQVKADLTVTVEETKCQDQENQESPVEQQEESCRNIEPNETKADDSDLSLRYSELLSKFTELEARFSELDRDVKSLDRKVIELLADKSNLPQPVNENEEEVKTVLKAFSDIKSILGGLK